jgi:hypothetical protein
MTATSQGNNINETRNWELSAERRRRRTIVQIGFEENTGYRRSRRSNSGIRSWRSQDASLHHLRNPVSGTLSETLPALLRG